MIGFEQAAWLWLIAPGLLLWWGFVRVQRRALAWLEVRVAPRFRERFSVYGRPSLWLHMGLLLLMGLALVVAAAGPFAAGRTEAASATGRLLFLVDASASMYANDVEPVEPDSRRADETPHRRIDVAREVARGLMGRLAGYRYALASFSGSGAIHLPMTSNAALVDDALRTLEVHSYYRNTGSSLARALDVVPHFVDRRGYRLQVVILSDGEQPVPEDYGAALAALAEQDVPVHSIAIGSVEGQSRRILNFQDVVEKKKDPRVLVEYTTRRVDEHLEQISDRTGGSFFVAAPGVVDRLAAEVLEAGSDLEPFEHDAARTDLSGRFLTLFLVAFLFDAIWFGRKPRYRGDAFDVSRLGEPAVGGRVRARREGRSQLVGGRSRKGRASRAAAVLVAAFAGFLAVVSCALPLGESDRGGARRRAHRENEYGIAQDALGRHLRARTHYERSRAYGVEPHVPVHNLARSVLLTGDYSEAHDLFQEALLLAPDLPEAHFNDAMTLYLWGQAERDPQDCDLERTRELWLQARRRFSSAVASASERSGRGQADSVADSARDNRQALSRQIEEVERLIAEPPDACRGGGGGGAQEQEAAGGSGGGAGAGGAGQGGTGGAEPGQQAGGAGTEPQENPVEPGSGGAGAPEDPGEDEGGSGEPGRQGAGDGSSEGESRGAGDLSDLGDLSQDELGEISRQLERLAEQRRESGKFHRRTLPEQFRKQDWANPDPAIWW